MAPVCRSSILKIVEWTLQLVAATLALVASVLLLPFQLLGLLLGIGGLIVAIALIPLTPLLLVGLLIAAVVACMRAACGVLAR